MKLTIKESKIHPEDKLVQVDVSTTEVTSSGSKNFVTKTVWIKEKYAVLTNLLRFEGDDGREWDITHVYSNTVKEAKFVVPGDIWDTQPIQRGNK